MAQIDFAVAFIVIFAMIVYSVLIVFSTVTKDFNYFTTKEVEKSQDSLSKQLFETLDDKSLISNFKKIQILFEEIGGYSHINENLRISIKPIMSKIHVYDQSMNEIPSSNFTTGDYINVTFDLGFSANQKRYVNIFYFGGKTDEIVYNSKIYEETNISARILSEEEVVILSQDKCDSLQDLTYDEAKNNFGFVHNFRIDNYCIYGEQPPFAANIIVKSVTLLVEKVDGTIYPEYITLKVW